MGQSCDQLVAAYVAYLTRRRESRGSAIAYGPFLRRYAAWVGERAVGEVSAAEIEMEYLSAWHVDFKKQHGREPAANTQRNHIQALRSFYAWMDRFDWLRDGTGALARNPMTKVESVVVKRRIREWLRPD